MVPAGLSTGGGSLDAGSSAESTSGDIRGGGKQYSFTGHTINKGVDNKTLMIYAAVAVVAFVIYKKVA